MRINRRNFLSSTAFLGLSSIIPCKAISSENQTTNFNSNELRIGVITYSYRSLPSNLYSVMKKNLETFFLFYKAVKVINMINKSKAR